MTEDGRLLRRYIDEKSEAAFAKLTSRYLRLVYGTCLRELGDSVLAEDATQVVFLILARKAGSLKSEAALASWLFTTSRLTARQIRKQEYIRRQREHKAFEQNTANETSIAWLEIVERMNDAVSRLNVQDREVVLLRFFEGMSLKEIGEICGVSENTAGARVTRAVSKLRLSLVRDGIAITTIALAAALTTEAARALPISSATDIAARSLHPIAGALPGTGAGIPHSITLTHTLQQTAQGVIQQMVIKKTVTVLVALGIGALTATGVYTAASRASSAADSKTSAQALDVLQRCQATYGAMTTYDGTVEAKGDTTIGSNHIVSSATAHIAFQRPDKLRIAGLSMFPGQSYDMIANGPSTKMFIAGKLSTYPMRGVEDGISGLTGISMGAGALVPAMLVHSKTGDCRLLLSGVTLTLSTESINGIDTYHVVSTSPAMVNNYWIDRNTLLLIKTTEDFSNNKIRAHFDLNYDKPIIDKPIPAADFAN